VRERVLGVGATRPREPRPPGYSAIDIFISGEREDGSLTYRPSLGAIAATLPRKGRQSRERPYADRHLDTPRHADEAYDDLHGAADPKSAKLCLPGPEGHRGLRTVITANLDEKTGPLERLYCLPRVGGQGVPQSKSAPKYSDDDQYPVYRGPREKKGPGILGLRHARQRARRGSSATPSPRQRCAAAASDEQYDAASPKGPGDASHSGAAVRGPDEAPERTRRRACASDGIGGPRHGPRRPHLGRGGQVPDAMYAARM
jgi:hypothetical protein